MNIDYRDPWVLVLNITVIIILTLLIIPTLLNTKEKLGVRLSFSAIFMVVAVNCLANLALFYSQDIAFFDFLFMQAFIPLLFGPAVYFYVILNNGSTVKKPWIHFMIPFLAIIYGTYHVQLTDAEKIQVFHEVNEADNMGYNILNTLVMSIPLVYFYFASKFLKRLPVLPGDPLAPLKKIKIRWSHEFINLLLFCVFSFLVIIIVATYYYQVPQPYLDLIGMPLYFPLIYAVIAVRSNMTSKQLEMQYELSKAEEESRMRDYRITISRDLHDNIGAYANSLIAKIDFLSADEKAGNGELADLKENAENILALLRQTIWVLNNDAMSVEDFYDYVKQYVLKSFRNSGITVSFDEDIRQNRILPSEISINLFRIIQEGLQNIMKHSRATQVDLNLISAENLHISLCDNGEGFFPATADEGYGLANMRTRAGQIGFKVEILTAEPSGTLLVVEEYTHPRIEQHLNFN